MKQLALAVLLLVGCAREKKEDPLLAEVKSPLHVTVRAVEANAPRQCFQRPTLIQKLKCPLEPAHRVGCTYVEIGHVADSPLESDTPRWQRCAELASLLGGVTRVMLSPSGARRAQIWVEPGEKRIALMVEQTPIVLLLKDGSIYATIRPDPVPGILDARGEVDWSRAGGLIEALPQLEFDVTNEAIDAALANDPDGLAKLARVMHEDDGASVLAPAWLHAWSLLDPVQRRALEPPLRDAALGGNEAALAWFVVHPEMRDADWTNGIAKRVRAGDDMAGPLTLLAKDHPEFAGQLACERLAISWESERQYVDQGFDDLSSIAVPAAIIARLKVKCPWATAVLQQHECESALHCPDDGPLCDEAAQAVVVQSLTLAPDGARLPLVPKVKVDPFDFPVDEYGETIEPEEEEEEQDDSVEESEEERLRSSGWGPALLAAARVQAPLPADLVMRSQRRAYAQTVVRPDAGADFCTEASTVLADWVCEIPSAAKESVSNGCRVNLDDTRRSATFTSEPEEDE